MAERYVLLTVEEYGAPYGVRSIPTPFPADAVEEFVSWVRRNRQWRNDPSMLARVVDKMLKTLNKVGPLSQEPSPVQPVSEPLTPAPTVIPCPHCDRTFGQLMHLARHLKAKHPQPADTLADPEE